MSEQTIDNKVLERIKKMLALSNDSGATEAERETALRMAYNTLAKYNLSLSDLPSEQDAEVRERQDVVISADRWARNLSMAVAKLFFCKYFYSQTGTSGKDKHCFVGRQSNVITAKYMSEYLIKSVKREASKRYKSPTSPEGRSFCVGTVRSIGARVEQMLQQDTESTPGTALALIGLHKREAEANEAWLADEGTSLTTSKGRADNSLRSGAYHSGKEYGKTVSLNHQVTNTSKDFKRLN
jgi:hypothetical protein